METNLQLLISGISSGCVYGLVALGFVLIYKSTEMVNFAQGELMMLGAFLAVTFTHTLEWNYFIAIAATVLCMGVFGLLLERSILRQMIGQPPFAILMVTIGLGFVLRSIAGMIWGHNPQLLKAPYWGSQWFLGDMAISIPVVDIVIIGGTFAICGLLFLFLRFTQFGIAMQATSQNQLAAYYVGIPVKFVVAFTWALSAAIAALAGILLAPAKSAFPEMGLMLGIKAFAAAIVGGFGSLPGAIIAGLAIGIIESFAKLYVDPIVGMGISETSAYLLLLIMLFIRPSGLIATIQKKKV